MKTLRFAMAALALIAVSGAPAFAQQAKQAGQGKRYPVEGKVTVVNNFTRQVTVQTKEIPGLEGKTMTVAFVAKDSAHLARFKEGEEVKGELVVSQLDTYLENVTPKDANRDTKKG